MCHDTIQQAPAIQSIQSRWLCPRRIPGCFSRRKTQDPTPSCACPARKVLSKVPKLLGLGWRTYQLGMFWTQMHGGPKMILSWSYHAVDENDLVCVCSPFTVNETICCRTIHQSKPVTWYNSFVEKQRNLWFKYDHAVRWHLGQTSSARGSNK